MRFPQRDRADYGLTLTGFEPGVLFVDDINPAFAADDAAVLVTLLERPEGIANFHDTAFKLSPWNY
jgi:hypothetical protein